MTCSEAQGAMRTSARGALRAETDDDLAAHLRGCATCRMIAMQLEAGTDLLAELVASRGSVPYVPGGATSSRGRYRRAAALALFPIAAAAAGVLLFRRETAAPVSTIHVDRDVAKSVSVDVSHGQTATVINTRDPNVIIVWLTPGGTE